MKYIDAEKLKAEIERRRKFHDDAVVKFCNNRTIALTHSAGLKEDEELLTFLDTLSEEPDKSLDEAAEDFVWEVMENDEDGISDLRRKLYPTSKINDFYDALAEFFKAGAKWQYQKDRGEFAKIKAKTWCEGFDAHKEQMLKDTVEGEIHLVGFNNAIFIKEPRVEILDHYNVGDRVRIVILKA